MSDAPMVIGLMVTMGCFSIAISIYVASHAICRAIQARNARSVSPQADKKEN